MENLREKVVKFWEEESEENEKIILADILGYANSNPQSFTKEFDEIKFEEDLDAISVVFEALAKDIDNWGQLFIDTIDNIFAAAKVARNPDDILVYLMDCNWVAKNPFVQKIVDRIYKELDADNLHIQVACIQELSYYIKNSTIRNKNTITDALQSKLKGNDWKLRVVTFQILKHEGLLPAGYQLSFMDKVRKIIGGGKLLSGYPL